jgi:5'-3' exonuclease, N-terminal resolvase-like domain/T4 RNase H, C terminal
MILVDLSQIILANVMQSMKEYPEINEDIIRHMILNSIRFYNKKFKKEYGEIVLCCDDFKFWRREVFPYYKANRKKGRDASLINWSKIFENINKIKEDLKEHFPYRLIQVETAEADDVIASLVMANSLEYINNNNKILIVSGDHDFIQLHRYPNVEQYDPIKKRKITNINPDKYLKEHIIRGDIGDGIPNMLSSDNCLVIGTRQNSISTKKLEDWLSQDYTVFCDREDILRNYKRNEMLVDLSKIPENIQSSIIKEYENEAGKNRSKILPYFIKNRLNNLMDYITDF